MITTVSLTLTNVMANVGHTTSDTDVRPTSHNLQRQTNGFTPATRQ